MTAIPPAQASTQPDQADINAWTDGVVAAQNPTAHNVGLAFLAWNFDRAEDGLPHFFLVNDVAYYGVPGDAVPWFHAATPSPAVSHSAPVSHPATPAVTVGSSTSAAGGVWACIRQHESGGNYSINTGNGFYGAYQFTQQTWNGLGLSGNPANASPAVQDAAAQKLQAQSGWGNWPVTSKECGA